MDVTWTEIFVGWCEDMYVWIPHSEGTGANTVNFQIYLLEGLHRWNQDRGAAALSSGTSALRSYSGDLLHCVNENYQKLFGRKVAPQFCLPSCYTGELIGVQYLFRQTGQALQDMHPDSEETAQLIEQHDVEDKIEEDEGFSDISDDPTVLEVPHAQSSLTQGGHMDIFLRWPPASPPQLPVHPPWLLAHPPWLPALCPVLHLL
ncbi:uncharacterized protein LOC111667307 [Seriola lalandi dorsalis]|uniref:uncharacterized protein LOC111667307 n=1 Tax=Seriola lalandi dorsalis TaxID=1841481 RepID=UPI000C6F8761|nr:uncharacterized protein LOC111667307 [Seriola lalandi dorsalis]